MSDPDLETQQRLGQGIRVFVAEDEAIIRLDITETVLRGFRADIVKN